MTLLAQPPQVSAEPESTLAHLSRPGLRERVVIFITLFAYAWGTPPEWLVFARGGEAESSIITQALFLLLFVHTVVCLNGNWHVVLNASKREPLIAWFVGLAFVSTAWSAAAATTFQEGVVLIITYITALHLVVRFELRETVAILAGVFAAGALINLAFIAIFQDLSTFQISLGDGNDGSWNGITAQKNSLGRAATLGFVVCATHARVSRSWVIWPGFALLNLILIFGSRSSTSLGGVIGVTILSLVYLGFRGRKTLYGATMVSMFVVFTLLITLSATNLAAATGLLGKDATFTGRAPLWLHSFTFGVSERPLLGFGRGGFWGNNNNDFEILLRAFNTPHAHNAWIDALLEVGPLGALILTGIYARGLLWSTRRIRAVPSALGMFPAAFISLGFVFSTTESGFISRSIQFIIFVVAITEAARQKGKRQRFQDHAPQAGRTKHFSETETAY